MLLKLLLMGFCKAQHTDPFYLIYLLMTLYSFQQKLLSNYADDNNRFNLGKYINKVKDTLVEDFGIATNWFY